MTLYVIDLCIHCPCTHQRPQAPKDDSPQQLTVELPAGTNCAGGTGKDLCLASFTTTAGFGNCVVVSQGSGAAKQASSNPTSGQVNSIRNGAAKGMKRADQQGADQQGADQQDPSKSSKSGKHSKDAGKKHNNNKNKADGNDKKGNNGKKGVNDNAKNGANDKKGVNDNAKKGDNNKKGVNDNAKKGDNDKKGANAKNGDNAKKGANAKNGDNAKNGAKDKNTAEQGNTNTRRMTPRRYCTYKALSFDGTWERSTNFLRRVFAFVEKNR